MGGRGGGGELAGMVEEQDTETDRDKKTHRETDTEQQKDAGRKK